MNMFDGKDFGRHQAECQRQNNISLLISRDNRIKDLERQLDEAREDVVTYKYDLETLIAVLNDCVNKMSSEECYDTLKQVADHYKQLKEQGDECL